MTPYNHLKGNYHSCPDAILSIVSPGAFLVFSILLANEKKSFPTNEINISKKTILGLTGFRDAKLKNIISELNDLNLVKCECEKYKKSGFLINWEEICAITKFTSRISYIGRAKLRSICSSNNKFTAFSNIEKNILEDIQSKYSFNDVTENDETPEIENSTNKGSLAQTREVFVTNEGSLSQTRDVFSTNEGCLEEEMSQTREVLHKQGKFLAQTREVCDKFSTNEGSLAQTRDVLTKTNIVLCNNSSHFIEKSEGKYVLNVILSSSECIVAEDHPLELRLLECKNSTNEGCFNAKIAQTREVFAGNYQNIPCEEVNLAQTRDVFSTNEGSLIENDKTSLATRDNINKEKEEKEKKERKETRKEERKEAKERIKEKIKRKKEKEKEKKEIFLEDINIFNNFLEDIEDIKDIKDKKDKKDIKGLEGLEDIKISKKVLDNSERSEELSIGGVKENFASNCLEPHENFQVEKNNFVPDPKNDLKKIFGERYEKIFCSDDTTPSFYEKYEIDEILKGNPKNDIESFIQLSVGNIREYLSVKDGEEEQLDYLPASILFKDFILNDYFELLNEGKINAEELSAEDAIKIFSKLDMFYDEDEELNIRINPQKLLKLNGFSESIHNKNTKRDKKLSRKDRNALNFDFLDALGIVVRKGGENGLESLSEAEEALYRFKNNLDNYQKLIQKPVTMLENGIFLQLVEDTLADTDVCDLDKESFIDMLNLKQDSYKRRMLREDYIDAQKVIEWNEEHNQGGNVEYEIDDIRSRRGGA